MANLTSTTNTSVIVPEVIANEALGALGNYLNIGKTVLMDSDIESSRLGKVLSIPKRGTVTASSKTEGSDVTYSAPTATDTTVTLDQHWYVTIAEEDFTRAVQKGSMLPGYVEDAAIALAEKIENHLLANVSSFPNIDAAASSTNTAVLHTATNGIVDVRKKLIEAKVPMLMTKYGYISPRFYARLLKEDAILATSAGETARASGIVGTVAGVQLFEGQLTPGSGSPSWDQNFFYTKNALVLVTRPLEAPTVGVESATVMSEAGVALRYVRGYDMDKMATVIQLDTLFGSGINDVRHGYVLESQD